MMRIAICDDEKTQQDKYAALLRDIAEEMDLPIQLDIYGSGKELLFHMEDSERVPDVLFMDINMPEMDGMEISHRLCKAGYNGVLVFLTMASERMPQAFDVHAFHYIVKQVTPEEQTREIARNAFLAAEEQQAKYLLLTSVGEYRNIPIRKIEYFETAQRIITVHYEPNQCFEFVSTMGKLEARLFGNGFIRIAKSFLVSLEHIAGFSYETVTLRSGQQLSVGRKYYKELKDEMERKNSNIAI